MILVFSFFFGTLVSAVNSDKQESLSSSYSAPPEQQNNGYYDMMSVGGPYMEKEDSLALLAASIPGGGMPGDDYPILSSVPDTDFECGAEGSPGYFADTAEEARCQVFHICQFDGRHDSFLCPNGSIFNQRYFVCDWWFNVDCAKTDMFTELNARIGKVDEDRDASSYNQAPSLEYGPPKPLDGKYSAPESPSQEYSAPKSPSLQYSAPESPSQQYSAPTKPAQPQGVPRAPSQQHIAHMVKDIHDEFRQSPSQLYEAPSQNYSPPKRPNKKPSRYYELPGY